MFKHIAVVLWFILALVAFSIGKEDLTWYCIIISQIWASTSIKGE
jgi:hypothetical protein